MPNLPSRMEIGEVLGDKSGLGLKAGEALAACLSALPSGVFATDASGILLLAEGGAWRALDLEDRLHPGEPLLDQPGLPPWFAATFRRALTSGAEAHCQGLYAQRWYQLVVRPVAAGLARPAWILGGLQELSGGSDELEDQREQLLEVERSARAVAENAARREAFLSEASRKLAMSLDWETTISTVTRLAIPQLTDGAAVLIYEQGKLRQVSAVHREPGIQAAMQELFERYPPDPQLPVGMGHIMQTGETLFIEEVPRTFVLSLARSPEHLALLERLHMKSYIGVPLSAQARVLGVLIFATRDRRFNREDIGLVEELARRCSAAIENARLYQEVQQAVRVREDFLAVASHELRTPLTPLKLLLSRLEVRLRDSDANAAALVRRASSSVSRLATLVGDLLDVTQLQAGKLSLRRESCLVGELVSEVVDGYTRVSKRHQLVLVNRAPEARVMGDRSRLEQVFTNLVDNAIKYSPQGGEVRVELEVADGEVVVSVTDSGIGIARDQQDRIFTRFFRASSAPVANYGGLGLGLHISRQIVERHHGRITFESVLGEGSTFRVALPLAGTSATRTASKRDARS